MNSYLTYTKRILTNGTKFGTIYFVMKTLSSTLSASKARNNFYTILDEVSQKLKRFVITRRGSAQAVVMNLEEVEAWEETMEIMANNRLVRDILRSEKDRLEGKVISEKALLKKLGISPKDLR